MSGDDAAAALHELAQLMALFVRQRRDARQDQRSKRREMRLIEQTIVHHLERHAGFDQRLIPAVDVVLDFAGTKPSGLLRIDQPNARERRFIAQILFPTRESLINLFNRFEPALVMQQAAEFREPRAQAIRHAFRDP